MGKDKKAQEKRAQELREQISEILAERDEGTVPSHRRNAPRTRPLSPRDFIHKRMRELEERDKDE